MTDWTSGYMAEVGYSFGYFPELNPLRARAALINLALAPPPAGPACELGFGQGVSINIHAAASATPWRGDDFIPGQVAFARELAGASGADVQLTDEAFADFCARPDLPDFAFIALHGIWSWVSDANRAVIIDFLRRKLLPGGVAYISHNVLPGQATMVSLRHLLNRHAAIMEPAGRPLIPRVGAALDFAERLLARNPGFTGAHPKIGARLKQLRGRDPNYLAHEYFNQAWRPMHFDETAALLAEAKLGYGGPAHPLDQVDALNLKPEQRAFLDDVPDPVFRETVRDFMTYQPFRRDYWIKGARPLSKLEQAEAMRRTRFVLTTPADAVGLTARGVLGDTRLRDDLYRPLLAVMADLRPRTVGEIETALKSGDAELDPLFKALMILVGKDDLAPAQDEAAAAEALPRTRKLNAHLTAMARSGGAVNVLASPLTGGGVTVDRTEQLFLLAAAEGRAAPADWAAFAGDFLGAAASGTPADLTARAQAFSDVRLPSLQALMIA